eukprot:TRINITY_DN13691_c0_g1_i1.p1 TRINITY_DN13691_c0_g1~~TRINITY_DN13691_c0_g1_i1.p1  ORF type:complete len:422 (-),score=132.06 TRINITY_DN13691_c0_g1_i1:51-1316(-)
MRQLVVRGLSGQSACISLASGDCSVEHVQERIFSSVGVPPEQQKLVIGGKLLTQDVLDSVSASDIIFVSLSVRVVGGKGGFGSLLRGGQSGVGAKKITNFGSMRDLQGRRIKDVEKAKKIAKALAKQNGEEVSEDDDAEDANTRNRKRRRVLRKKMRPGQEQNEQQPQAKPPTAADLAEVKYSQTRKEILDNVASAMEEGLKRAKQIEKEERRRKRKLAKAQPAKIFGFELEEELLSSSDESEDEKDADEKKTKEGGDDDSEYEWVSESYSDSDDENEEGNVQEGDVEEGGSPNGADDDQESPSRGLKRSRPDDAEGEDETPQNSNEKTSSSSSSAPAVSSSADAAKPTSFDPIDLSEYSSAKELESVGLEHLKHELQRLGLLCGGNLIQRAERLFSTKGKSPAEFDPSILAANASKKRKK